MAGKRNRDPTERFMEKVNKTKTCWLWTATKHLFGYGGFSYQSKKIAAHRFSYLTFVGSIPAGKSVLHICDVPSCVNPDHLFLGDQKINVQDMDKKGRRGDNQNANKTHCIRGHKFSGYNLMNLKSGKRGCRICANAAAREYREGIKSLVI